MKTIHLHPLALIRDAALRVRERPLMLLAPAVSSALLLIACAACLLAGMAPWSALSALGFFLPLLGCGLTVHCYAAALYQQADGEALTDSQILSSTAAGMKKTIFSLVLFMMLLCTGLMFFLAGVFIAWPVGIFAVLWIAAEQVPFRNAVTLSWKTLKIGGVVWVLFLTCTMMLLAGSMVTLLGLLAGPAASVMLGPLFWALMLPVCAATLFARSA